MSALRGGLIGCGFFATNQLEAWREIEGASIVALCDRDPARLRAAGERFGIGALYADAGGMLAAERLDFVDVATTTPSHRALVEMAAGHEVAVICQKPMAATLEDARAMVEAAERAGVAFMVHENFRWQTPIMKVRQAIDEGRIGAPFWGRVSFRSAHDVYAAQPYLATGERFIIEDLGIHVLDVARFLLGEVEAVTARTRRVNPRIRGEDVATMLLDHRGGVTSVVDCSYASRLEREAFPETFVEVDGTAGTIRLGKDYRMTVAGPHGASVEDVSPQMPAWGERPWHNIQESVVNIQRHWVDVLGSGGTPATSGRDNLRTLELVEAAYRSAASAPGGALPRTPPGAEPLDLPV